MFSNLATSFRPFPSSFRLTSNPAEAFGTGLVQGVYICDPAPPAPCGAARTTLKSRTSYISLTTTHPKEAANKGKKEE